jgi:hypothetical protein
MFRYLFYVNYIYYSSSLTLEVCLQALWKDIDIDIDIDID